VNSAKPFSENSQTKTRAHERMPPLRVCLARPNDQPRATGHQTPPGNQCRIASPRRLTGGGKAEEKVWAEFGGDAMRCQRMAEAIIERLRA
jgi:hypothetical protein